MGNEPDFGWLIQLFRQETGFQANHLQLSTLKYRLAALADREKLGPAEELLRKLQPGMLRTELLVEALLNHETQFFRDGHLFELLQTQILPELLQLNRPLNFWSAACSLGHEAYTLALIARRFAGAQMRVLASDLSEYALDYARRGSYLRTDIERTVPAAYWRYFQFGEKQAQLTAEVQKLVSFRRLNLIREWPALPSMQLVLMRNVLIYLEAQHKQRILDRLAQQIAPGGYVILGATESLIPSHPAFETAYLRHIGGCFRRRNN